MAGGKQLRCATVPLKYIFGLVSYPICKQHVSG
jgi:hypothetical protein